VRLSESVFRSAFGRNVLALGSGTALGQAVVFATTPVLTRIYGPNELALIGLFLAFIAPATVALTLRYDLAIVLGRNDDDARDLLAFSLLLLPATSVVAGGVFYALIKTGVGGYETLPLWAAPCMTLLLVATGAFTCLRFWCVRVGRFREIGFGLIQQGIARATVPILMGALTRTWVGLLVGEIAGRALGIRRLLDQSAAAVQLGFFRLNWKSIRTCLVRYKSFPLVILPSSVLDAISGTISVPVFAATYGTQLSGHFFLAYRVVVTPAVLISAAVADVYQHRILSATRSDPKECQREVFRAGRKLFIVSCCVYLPIAIVAPFASRLVFGNDWIAVGPVIASLTPAAISCMVTNPLGRTIAMSALPQIKFLSDVVRLVLPVSAIIVSYTNRGSFLSAAACFAVATFVGDCCYFLVVLYAVAPSRLRSLVENAAPP
jgi:O-antigen/teichoic acid export membrane protein